MTLRARAGRLRAALDADGDGVVTKDEWRAGLESPELRALLRPEPGSADEGHASSTHARLATELADLRAGAANGLRGMMAGIRAPAALSPSAYASAALSSSAYALPEDRCLPDEGATCREVCVGPRGNSIRSAAKIVLGPVQYSTSRRRRHSFHEICN